MYTILNAFKGMVELKVKPEMVLSVLHVIHSSPLQHVFYNSVGNRSYISVTRSAIFCRRAFCLVYFHLPSVTKIDCWNLHCSNYLCVPSVTVNTLQNYMKHKCIQCVVSLCQPHFTSHTPMH